MKSISRGLVIKNSPRYNTPRYIYVHTCIIHTMAYVRAHFFFRFPFSWSNPIDFDTRTLTIIGEKNTVFFSFSIIPSTATLVYLYFCYYHRRRRRRIVVGGFLPLPTFTPSSARKHPRNRLAGTRSKYNKKKSKKITTSRVLSLVIYNFCRSDNVCVHINIYIN